MFKIKSFLATIALVASSLILVAVPLSAAATSSAGQITAIKYRATRPRHTILGRHFGINFYLAPARPAFPSVSAIFNLTPTLAPALPTVTKDAQAIVQQSSPAVVYINAYKQTPTFSFQYGVDENGLLTMQQVPTGFVSQQQSSGSGFFVTGSGYILTNKHVVSDTAAMYQVVYNGQQMPATVVYRDPALDLAIVKVDGANFPTLPEGDSASVVVGQNVVAIGNALGKLTDFATQGTVAALNQTITVNSDDGSSEILSNVIQTTAKLFPGDSGGPLLNLNGQVVGIDTATSLSGSASAGFSIPSNTAKQVLTSAGISW